MNKEKTKNLYKQAKLNCEMVSFFKKPTKKQIKEEYNRLKKEKRIND